MDNKFIIKKLKEEVENLKLHIEMLELIMLNLEEFEDETSTYN